MKKGLKFWSKLLIASFFLGGMATSAMAQNGTIKANCAGKLGKTYTRTQLQMTEGTIIPIKFNVAAVTTENPGGNPGLVGDKYYVVAATNGSLSNVECNDQIGANLEFEGTANSSNDETATVTTYNNDLVLGELNPVGEIGTDGMVYLKVKNTASTVQGTYLLGIFIKDDSDGNDGGGTSCFSDVYWVEIKVVTPIYAALTLNNNTNDEYICSSINGGVQLTTGTNIGFTLCNVPQTGGKLYYTVEPTFTSLTGVAMDTTGTANTSIPTLTTGTETTTYVNVTEFDAGTTDKYTLKMGAQTLTNTLSDVASTVDFEFKEGVTKFYYEYTNDEGVSVNLPIIFQTTTQYCGVGSQNPPAAPEGDQLSKIFTVHVAPNYQVRALAYKEGERPESVTGGYMNGTGFVEDVEGTAAAPKFCQGLDAYLHTEYSTTGENSYITSYTWTQVAPTDAAQQLTITTTSDRAPVTSDLAQLSYTLNVATLWNDAETGGNYGTGCPANDNITITVTEAPRLLVQATNSTFTHNGEICPGTIINITAQDGDLAEGHTTTADNILATTIGAGVGAIINHNDANFNYTIETSGNELKVFDTWRSTEVTGGKLPVDQDFFDNEDNTNPIEAGTITYTIQTIAAGQEGAGTNTCPLVNADGTALTVTTTTGEGEGAVTTTTVTNHIKLVYTVSPRPQFQLGAN